MTNQSIIDNLQSNSQTNSDLFFTGEIKIETLDNSKNETKMNQNNNQEKGQNPEVKLENDDFDFEGFQSAIPIIEQKYIGSNILNLGISEPTKKENEFIDFTSLNPVESISKNKNGTESSKNCIEEKKDNQVEETTKKEYKKPNIYEIDWSETKEAYYSSSKTIDPVNLELNKKTESNLEVEGGNIYNEEFEWAEAKPSAPKYLEEAKYQIKSNLLVEKKVDNLMIKGDDWKWSCGKENKNDDAITKNNSDLLLPLEKQQSYTFPNNYENKQNLNINHNIAKNNEDLFVDFEDGKMLQPIEKSSEEKAKVLIGDEFTDDDFEWNQEKNSPLTISNNLMISTSQTNTFEIKPQIAEEKANEKKIGLESERIEWTEVIYEPKLVKSQKNIETSNNGNLPIKKKNEMNLLDFEFFEETTTNENNFVYPKANFISLQLFKNCDSDQMDQKKENVGNENGEEKKEEYENDDFEWAGTPIHQKNIQAKNLNGKKIKNL